MKRVGVIMAGGSGERFWPLSTKERPKQLLRLTSPTETMLGEAVSRLTPVIPPEDMYVITGEHLVAPIRQGQVGVPDENVVAEPCKRNTAGALTYAAAHLLAKYGVGPDRLTMAITTADHLISDADRFRDVVRTAIAAAEEHDALATIGVVPSRAETGYGYIQITGEKLEAPSHAPVYPVAAFHEKPNAQRAEDFVASGDFFWNSGMFFWKAATFLAELDHARPGLARATREIAAALQREDENAARLLFEDLEDISIDYALMEKAKHVLMVRADFHWDDVGAWPALDRTLSRDDAGNVLIGGPVVEDCQDCIIYNAAADGPPVGVIGLRDMVVVVSNDGVLAMPKSHAQDVKKVVTQVRKRLEGK